MIAFEIKNIKKRIALDVYSDATYCIWNSDKNASRKKKTNQLKYPEYPIHIAHDSISPCFGGYISCSSGFMWYIYPCSSGLFHWDWSSPAETAMLQKSYTILIILNTCERLKLHTTYQKQVLT